MPFSRKSTRQCGIVFFVARAFQRYAICLVWTMSYQLTCAVQCCIILQGSWGAWYPCHQLWQFCGIHIDFLGHWHTELQRLQFWNGGSGHFSAWWPGRGKGASSAQRHRKDGPISSLGPVSMGQRAMSIVLRGERANWADAIGLGHVSMAECSV